MEILYSKIKALVMSTNGPSLTVAIINAKTGDDGVNLSMEEDTPIQTEGGWLSGAKPLYVQALQ